jgi:hypothetical protein
VGEVTTKLTYDKTTGKKLKIYCSRCGGETNHVVLKSATSQGSEVVAVIDGHTETIDWSDDYQIIQCQGCETISFRHLSWFSEAEEYYGLDNYSDGTTTRLYPKRSKDTRPIRDYYNVPPILRRIYRESLDCFNNDSFTLCAAGLRAIVEGLCSTQGVTDGPVEVKKKDGTTIIQRSTSLQGKIAGLKEKGILTESQIAILHEHRYLGNEAVHELSSPSQDELALAIEILEHTLEGLYELPDKVDELRTRKANRLRKQNKLLTI